MFFSKGNLLKLQGQNNTITLNQAKDNLIDDSLYLGAYPTRVFIIRSSWWRLLWFYLTQWLRSASFNFSAFRRFLSDCLRIEYAYGAYITWLPVYLGTGVLSYYALGWEPQLMSLLIVNLICGLLLLWRADFSLKYLIPVSYILVLSLGLTVAKIETLRLDTHMLASPVVTKVAGRVEAIDTRANGAYRLLLRVNGTKEPKLFFSPQKIEIVTTMLPQGIRIGSLVEGRMMLSPFKGASSPTGLSFSFHQYFQQIGARARLLGKLEVDNYSAPLGLIPTFLQQIEIARTALSDRLVTLLPAEIGAVCSALITGKRGAISFETSKNLRVAGLAHILAISGLHMSLVVGAVLLFFRYFLGLFPVFSSFYPAKKLAAAIALLVALFYLLLSGVAVAALRSFIMVSVMLLAIILGRSALTIRNLAIAAFIILLFSPHQLLTPGFQLSFAATLILIASVNWWIVAPHADRTQESLEIPSWKRALRKWFWAPVKATAVTSLVVGFASGIYAWYHFDNLAPLGVVSNVLVFPVVSLLIMPAALVGTLAAPFGLESYFFKLMGVGVHYVLFVASEVAQRSFQDGFGFMPKAALVCFTLGLLSLCGFRTRLRYFCVAFFLLGFGLCYWRVPPLLLVSEKGLVNLINYEEKKLLLSKKVSKLDLDVANWGKLYHASHIIGPVNWPYLAKGSQFMCQGQLCIAALKNGDILAVALNEKAKAEACALGDLVVLSYRAYEAGCRGAQRHKLVLTQQQISLYGAGAVYLRNDKYRVKYLAGELERPWNQHRQFIRLD